MTPDYAVYTVHVLVRRNEMSEQDLKAVWGLLGLDPLKNVATIGSPFEMPSSPASPPAPVAGDWTERQGSDLFFKCKRIQRAILVCVAEAGAKNAASPKKDFFAAAERAARDNDGEPFSDRQLGTALSWITKFAQKVGQEGWPFKDFMKEGVWYFQMDPDMAMAFLRARDKFGDGD